MAGNVDRYAHLENGGRSEYGGGSNSPQRLPDGSPMDLSLNVNGGLADRGAVGLRARLARTAGMADFSPDPTTDLTVAETEVGVVVPSGAPAPGSRPGGSDQLSLAQQEALALDGVIAARRAERRADLGRRTNGYLADLDPEIYAGEALSTSSGQAVTDSAGSVSIGVGSAIKGSIEGDFR